MYVAISLYASTFSLKYCAFKQYVISFVVKPTEDKRQPSDFV